jgi:CO dehydrogenase/acetyl-CoA synthase epsilon subunit
MMYRLMRNWLSLEGKAYRNLAVMIGILAAILSKVGHSLRNSHSWLLAISMTMALSALAYKALWL